MRNPLSFKLFPPIVKVWGSEGLKIFLVFSFQLFSCDKSQCRFTEFILFILNSLFLDSVGLHFLSNLESFQPFCL